MTQVVLPHQPSSIVFAKVKVFEHLLRVGHLVIDLVAGSKIDALSLNEQLTSEGRVISTGGYVGQKPCVNTLT